jgi:N-formylglutamate amidohydrolase
MLEEHLLYPYHTDWYLDKLYDFLPGLGVPIITTNYSRYVVDLNRPMEEPIFGTFQDSPVFSHTSEGYPLYRSELNLESIQSRIREYYLPFHAALSELIDSTLGRFGKVILLDLHSFRSHYLPEDVCIGNINGTTCSKELLTLAASYFRQQGLSVAENGKFIGGYITHHYSQLENIQTMQIELSRSFYLSDEEKQSNQRPNPDGDRFTQAQDTLRVIFSRLVEGIEEG